MAFLPCSFLWLSTLQNDITDLLLLPWKVTTKSILSPHGHPFHTTSALFFRDLGIRYGVGWGERVGVHGDISGRHSSKYSREVDWETEAQLFDWKMFSLKDMYGSSVGFPGGASGKEPTSQCRRLRDRCLIPESGRSLAEGHSNPLCSLAWRIPWTEEPGGLQFIRLQRVGVYWATEHSLTLVA